MNNILALVKVDLKQSLDFRQLKKNKAKGGTLIGFLALMGILFLAISTIYSYIFAEIILEAKESLILSALLMSTIATMLTLTSAIVLCKQIFVAKDFEMLSAMPIKRYEIITSRIINLYIVEAIYTAIIMLPNMIINTAFSGDFRYIIVGILLLIGVEAFPILIATILGGALAIISARFKHSNIIIVIFSLLMFLGIFSLSFLLQTSEDLAYGFSIIANNVVYINPTTALIKLGFSNPSYYLAYIAGVIAIMALTVGFIALLFPFIHSLSRAVVAKGKYDNNALNDSGELKALFNIECKRLFSSKMYFINSAIGSIIGLLMSIMLTVSIMQKNTGSPEEIKALSLVIPMLPILISMFISMSTTTTSSISMEGKSFWLTKTMPINYKSLANAKLLVGFMTSIPAGIISAIIVAIFLADGIFLKLMVILFPIAYLIFMNVLGLRINLWLPKLNWTDEKQVIKQGGAAGFMVLFDFLVTILMALMMFLLLRVNIYLAYFLPILILLIMALAIYLATIKNIDSLISKIE